MDGPKEVMIAQRQAPNQEVETYLSSHAYNMHSGPGFEARAKMLHLSTSWHLAMRYRSSLEHWTAKLVRSAYRECIPNTC